MKKYILPLAFILLVTSITSLHAQSIGNYVFSTATSSSFNRSNGSLVDDIDMTTGTNILIGGSNNSGTGSTFTNIGFDFYVNGQRQTGFGVNSNGWMLLGNIPGAATTWLGGAGIRLAPFTGSSTATMGTSLIGRIHSKVIGSAPSRILVVEFLNMSINAAFLSDTNTFQVRLYEQTGEIEYVYGTMRCASGAPLTFNIGFSFSASLFSSVNPSTHTASTTSSTNYNIAANGITSQFPITGNGTRRSYLWTPNLSNDPTNFQITATGTTTMTLTWADASNEIGYVLYRSIDGGATYTFINTLPQNTTTSNQVGLPSATTIYWRLYAVRETWANPVDVSGNTLAAPLITSIASGNWNSTATWSSGTVPTAVDSVRISTGNTVTIDANATALHLAVNGTLVYGVINNVTLNIQSDISINTGGTFNAGTGVGTNALIIGGTNNTNSNGSLTNNGTFDMNTTAGVNTTFAGALNGSISGSGTTDFFGITVNKGISQTPILDVTSLITQRTATTTQILNLTSGTFRLSSASTITPYPGSAGFTVVQQNARMWLNNSGANIGTTTTAPGGFAFWQSLGELRIDNGTLTIGSGAHQGFGGAQSIVRMNGGTLNILGSLNFQSSNTSGLIMSAGSININPQASANLGNANTLFTIPSANPITWSGGIITIVNPHNTSGGTAVNFSSGGIKTITGGTLRIGNGVSGSASGGGNTSGFGITSTMDIWNLEINNNTNLSNTRMARLIGDFKVLNQLDIKTNGYLFLGSGNIGSTIQLMGNTNIIDGTIAGTEPTGTQNIGTIALQGTTGTQSVSGAGTFAAMNVLNLQNTGSGVTFNNTVAWNIRRVNLLSGSLNPGSNLIIGSNAFAGTIQVGGVDESTASGSFTAIPSFNTTFGGMVYIYGPTSSTLTTGAFNEMAAGAQNLSGLSINDANNLTANRAITTLNLTLLGGGNLQMGTNSLSIGTSATNAGTLFRTSGFVQLNSGTAFTRWYANATVPTYGYGSGFPILVGTNERTVQINVSGFLTAGGSITIRPTATTGFTDYLTPFTDSTISINRRTNSNWIVQTSGLNVGTGLLSFRFIGQGIGAVTNVSELRVSRANGIAGGTAGLGSGSNLVPQGNRDFLNADIPTNDTLYISGNSSVNPLSPTFTAVTNGAWNTASTWDANAVPTSANDVLIPSPFTVTLTSGTNNCANAIVSAGGTLVANAGTLNIATNLVVSGTASFGGSTTSITGTRQNGLTINSGGIVNVSGGTVAIGPLNGGDRTLNVNQGAFNISGGTITINGNYNVAASSTFTQSAGSLVIDGNSGTAASSVAQGTHLCAINTSSGLNCSGGNIVIVDPPHSSYTASSTNALRIAATASLSAFTNTHTFEFGNGTSTETGNVNGFNIDTKRSGVVPIQNVIVNAGNASNRFVSTSFSGGSFGTHIKGSLTINTGSEFRHITACQLAIGGNIINNGTLTMQFPFTLGGLGYVITNAQTISGSGTFRNNTSSPTGSFQTATIDNGTGLTLSTSATNFIFTGTLTIGANNITTNTNSVRLSSTGTLARTTGYIIGALGKNFAVGSNIARTFEIGSASNFLPVTIQFPTVSTAGDVVVSSTANDHPQLASSCMAANKTVNRFWTLTNIGTLPASYGIQVNYLAGEVDGSVTLASLRSQVYNGSNWLGNPTVASATSTQASISGLTNFGDFQLGEFGSFPVSVTISTAANTVCNGSNVLFVAVPTNGGTSPSYQWKINGSNVGTDNDSFSTTALVTSDAVTCVVTSNSLCVTTPTATSNALNMTVSPLTVKGAVTGGSSICSGSTSGLLSLSGQTGSVVRWQSAPSPFTSWSDISNTASNYTSGALTQTTAFRAVVASGACAAANADSTIVDVIAPSVKGAVSGTSPVCTGSTSSLTLTGHTGTVVKWQFAVAPYTLWTDITNTTTTHTSAALSQSTAFRAVVQNGICAAVNSDSFIVNIIASGIWLGTTSSNWNDASNWCGGIPTSSTNVVINSGTPNAPQINTTAVVNNITINSGASLSFSGAGNSLDIRGNITLTGTFNPANGTVIFAGAAAQNIPALTYSGLSMNGAGAKTLAGATTVNAVLTLTSGVINLGTNNLTLGNTASITGANATSFIVTNGTGRLVQQNIGTGGRTGNIVFPVGSSASSYTPATINNTGTADNINVRVIGQMNTAYTGETPSGSTVTNNAVGKTWFINEAVNGGSNISLTLQWNAADELTAFVRSNIKLIRYTSAWLTGATGAAVGSNPYTMTYTGVTGLTPFGIIDNISPLPVKFVSINASVKESNVLVNWLTAAEINNDYFEVERSMDGKIFAAIGKVQGAGNSNSTLSYIYVDKTAAKAFAQTNALFYRIKQVDFDGKYAYSNTIKVTSTGKNEQHLVHITPNPFTNEFVVNTHSYKGTSANIEVTDLVGKVVLLQNEIVKEGETAIRINTESLIPGMYTARITLNGVTTNTRLIKE